MTAKERQMVELLKELKQTHGLIGVKGEFEAEGASLVELYALREITAKADLKLVIKIGGCEAITDICLARTIGADSIVAPMIESPFAAQKFVAAMTNVFGGDEAERPDALINIETMDGVRNLNAILSLEAVKGLAGLDIGRVDMACSYGLRPEDSNSQQVFDACVTICERWNTVHSGKPCTVGGFLTEETICFLEMLSKQSPIQSESKKAVFCNDVIRCGGLKAAFLKAIEFETLWYQSCIQRYDKLCTENWGYFRNLPAYAAKLRGECSWIPAV